MTGTDIIKPSGLDRHLAQGAVSPDLAEEDYDEEKAKWKAGGTAKDYGVAHALQAHQDDRRLIDLHTVIAKALRPESHIPLLAVAPVTASIVSMKIHSDGELIYWVGRKRFPRWGMRMDAKHTWVVNASYGPYQSYSRVASLPPLPPDVRKITQKDHLILWEAGWKRSAKKAALAPAPADPALLEHVSGSLYIVRATWELSSLEAAALR